MALDLCCQLISASPANDCIWETGALQSSKFDMALGRLRRSLVAHLSEAPVYCLIDSVNEYEDDESKKGDLLRLMSALQAITNERHVFPFKLLITSRSSSSAPGLIPRGIS